MLRALAASKSFTETFQIQQRYIQHKQLVLSYLQRPNRAGRVSARQSNGTNSEPPTFRQIESTRPKSPSRLLLSTQSHSQQDPPEFLSLHNGKNPETVAFLKGVLGRQISPPSAQMGDLISALQGCRLAQKAFYRRTVQETYTSDDHGRRHLGHE